MKVVIIEMYSVQMSEQLTLIGTKTHKAQISSVQPSCISHEAKQKKIDNPVITCKSSKGLGRPRFLEETISANQGLNLHNPGIKFTLRLVSVPESSISAIRGIV